MDTNQHLAAALADLDVASLSIGTARDHITAAMGPPVVNVITDRTPRPLPPLPTVAPGQVITDPTFGSRIARVAGPDSDPDAPGISYRSSDSSLQRSWNATSTRFIVEDNWGRQILYTFDPPTLAVRRHRVLPFRPRRVDPHDWRRSRRAAAHLALPFNGADSSFHDTDPDRVFGVYGSRAIREYNVVTNATRVVLDLDSLGLTLTPPETYTGGLAVMNDVLVTCCGGEVQDKHHYVVVYPLTTGAVRTLDTLSLTQFNKGRGFYLHGTVLDLDARFVIMVPSTLSGDGPFLYLWDLDTDAIEQVTVGTSGHLAVGRGYWVNQDCAPGTTWDAAQWLNRLFIEPNSVENCIDPVLTPTEVYLAEHPSWTNMRTIDDPFATATYRYQPSEVPWRAWDEEIVTIRPTDGEVARYAHHRSLVMMPGTNAFDYWATPRVNRSPDGRFGLFTSNWGRTLGLDSIEGGDRQDPFIVEFR